MPSPRSPRNPEDQRLSVIAEDGTYTPQPSQNPNTSPGSTHRPFARKWNDIPPRASSDLKPPEYSTYDDSQQKRDRLAELRDRPAVTRRGGWKRLLIIFVIIIVLLGIALGVGLGVGLTRHKKAGTQSSGSSSSSSNPDNTNQTYPVGKYAITAFLANVDTSCTSNSATFRCYPYTTFSDSNTLSALVFNWIITATSNDFLISSSDNPFADSFANITLSLVDAGSANERYTFNTTMNKIVIPASSLSSDNTQSECHYNNTMLSAALYTKKNITGFSSATFTNATTAQWSSWPFAVELNQTVQGGQNVPTCYERINGATGSQITDGLTAQSSTSNCGCFYRNSDL